MLKGAILAHANNKHEYDAIYQILPKNTEIWIGIKTIHDDDSQYFVWALNSEIIHEDDKIEFKFNNDKQRSCATARKKEDKLVIRERNCEHHKLKQYLCQKNCSSGLHCK